MSKQIYEHEKLSKWLRKQSWNGVEASLILSDLLPDYCFFEEGNLSQGWKISEFSSASVEKIDFTSDDFIYSDEFNTLFDMRSLLEEKIKLISEEFMLDPDVTEFSPRRWLSWAIDKNFEIPWLSWALSNGFLREIRQHVSMDSYLSEKYLTQENDKGSIKSEIEAPSELTGKTKTYALQIIGGLVISTYKIDIHANRLQGLKEVLADLERVGIKVSSETLSGYLKEAAKLIEKSKP